MPPSILNSAPLRTSLLALPPHLRTAIYQRSAFSSTAGRATSLADLAIAGPSFVLDTLHATTGLPWAYTIPLTALLVRGVLLHHLITLPGRRRALIRCHLSPLIGLKARWALDETQRRRFKKLSEGSNSENGKLIIPPLPFFDATVMQLRVFGSVGRQFGAPLVSWRPLLNFGILIAFTESIRAKCGAREGLLSLVMKPWQWLWDSLLRKPHQQQVPEWQGTGGPPKVASLENSLTESGESLSTVGSGVRAQHIDDSMHAEGLPWIADLTTADPTLILPITFSASIILPVLLEARTKRSIQAKQRESSSDQSELATPPPQGKGAWLPLTNGQRLRVCVGFLFFFLFSNFPAGVLLYLTSSMIIAAVQRVWLQKRMPLPNPIMPCSRPVRMRVKKVWREV